MSIQAGDALRKIEKTDSDILKQFFTVLTQALKQDDTREQSIAIKKIDDLAGEIPTKITDTIDPLVGALSSSNADVRIAALEALGTIGTEEPLLVAKTITPIRRRLEDESVSVQAAAVDTLVRIGSANSSLVSSVPSDIEPLLSHADPSLRTEATQALGSIGSADPSAVEDVIDSLEETFDDNDPAVREAGLEAFETIGRTDTSMVEPVIPSIGSLLVDSSMSVQVAAANTIGTIGEQNPKMVAEAIDPLESRTDDLHEEIRRAATEALERIDRGSTSQADREPDPTSSGVKIGCLDESPLPESIPGGTDVTVDCACLSETHLVDVGGNADVVRATVQTDRSEETVAIKLPRGASRVLGSNDTVDLDDLEGWADVEELLAEAETWSKLDDHDHIVDVLDWGTHAGDVPWLAMEYMDGGHLGQRIDELELDQALWIALAITKGVRHANRRGIAHLDLKPENVLFRTVENGWDVPKVADWGLSKHLLEHSKTNDGLTLQYAAPEQFDDSDGPTDEVTDIYQLGAVVYHLFTGQPPFDGQPFEVMYNKKNGEFQPPTDVADIPPELGSVISKAMAKERDERYESVLYLRDALRRTSESLSTR